MLRMQRYIPSESNMITRFGLNTRKRRKSFMKYRKATKQDIEKLIGIRIEYLLEDFGELTKGQSNEINNQLSDYFINHLDKDLIIYIAEKNKEIISSVFLVIMEKPANPNFLTGKTGTILNVYTKPEYRKQGIAGRLINRVIEDAREMNLSYIDLRSTHNGEGLYRKIGFVEEQNKYLPMKFVL